MDAMSILDVINRVAAHRADNFVAPVFDSARTRVLVRQGGIPLTFVVSGVAPGWKEFEPRGQQAGAVAEAQPRDVVDYLEALREIRVITLFAVSPTTWVCAPYNASDARQKGWKTADPSPLHLVSASVQAFDVVVARLAGGTLLYDKVDERIDQSALRGIRDEISRGGEPSSSEFHVPIAIMIERQAEIRRRIEAERRRLAEIAEAERRHEIARVEAERRRALSQTIEGRLTNALAVVGAQLENWSESGRQIEVRWSIDGQTYRSYVNRNAEVVSAGFCMNGTDREHDLTTMVLSVVEAERRQRPDLHQIKD